MFRIAAAISTIAYGVLAAESGAEFHRGAHPHVRAFSIPVKRPASGKSIRKPHGPAVGLHEDHGVQLTYGFNDKHGWGIYKQAFSPEVILGNDGYAIKKREDPFSRLHSTVNAVCLLEDPDQKTGVRGLVRLQQAHGEKGTRIRAKVGKVGPGAKITINALGDLRDGCDSAGDIYDPLVADHGKYETQEVPRLGLLGDLKRGKDAAYTQTRSDVDLSGRQSIVGRSIVITRPPLKDRYGRVKEPARVACCTIGLRETDELTKEELREKLSKKVPAKRRPHARREHRAYSPAPIKHVGYGRSRHH